MFNCSALIDASFNAALFVDAGVEAIGVPIIAVPFFILAAFLSIKAFF